MTDSTAQDVEQKYQSQSFGTEMDIVSPCGLLLVDFVNGFADPDMLGGGNIGDAITNTAPLLEFARRQKWAIAHSRIVFADDDSDGNIFTLKVPNLLKLKEDTAASHIVESLSPLAGELVVRKTVPSAFFGTQLASWFTQNGVRSLVIAGVVTSGCVRASVVDAMCYGFRPVVISDCVGDRALEPHHANLFDMQQKYASVMSRSELLSRMQG